MTVFKTALMATPMLAAGLASADPLTIYTYESFVSEWGPGPQIEKAYEADCDCEVDFVGLEDGVALLNRLRLEGEDSQADIILGLDDALIAETKKLDLLAKHRVDLSGLTLPYDWEDDTFVPYDYGHFAFVYDQTRVDSVPSSLEELVYDSDLSIIYQDPRVSTPGQGLMLWMKSVFGDEAEDAWTTLQERVVTVTPGWSEAYSLFQEGESDMVLSYTTSPAYHMTYEDTDKYQAAIFSEGHYAQIEVAAVLKNSDQIDRARDFLAFLVSNPAQDVLPGTNWMWPVLDSADKPEAFEQMVRPETLYFSSETVAENRRDWLREWRNAASQ
ncbi:thiamine ABC transporter substrate binding subunit [Saccharospirillum salsuginis]|uniref:Thiamine-binding periplasmic protein n=1 Tax=Saccharospirillum salsuginis TaxID=418750 RepID=A0A918JZP9_9GAMM|nr:thiamine ABC transporter substrate binding subunit [Saccharospirillum salsuginis]GGX39425.1 thiamine transporter substrate binding subunit [Saccharospirillum salsuginis]